MSHIFYDFFVPGAIAVMLVGLFAFAVKADNSEYDRNHKR
jgi:hypothetical protein